MNKQEYLLSLKTLLNQYDIEEDTKDDIMNDYASLWQQYQELNMDDVDIISKLGNPKDIIHELTEGYIKKEIKAHHQKKSFHNKLIALTPFIALVLFFAGGFLINQGFSFSWIAFLIIPMTAIILEGPHNIIEKLTALSPFIAVILFIPILGFWLNLWHPGWIVFLMIPIIGGLTHPSRMKRFLISGGLLMTSITFIILDQFLSLGMFSISSYVSIPYSMFVFIPVIVILLVEWIKQITKNGIMYAILLVSSIALYVWISIEYQLWAFAWIIFFSIPVYAILKQAPKSSKLVALMPFISTSLFMILGYFNYWAFAWMVFLLIPVVAIIKEK